MRLAYRISLLVYSAASLIAMVALKSPWMAVAFVSAVAGLIVLILFDKHNDPRISDIIAEQKRLSDKIKETSSKVETLDHKLGFSRGNRGI